jgi:hypothetical protein
MSGNGYKALGFVVWKGGMWYLRRRYGFAKRLGMGALALAVAGGAVAVAQRRHGSGGAPLRPGLGVPS